MGGSLLIVTMGNPYANPHVLRSAKDSLVDGYQSSGHRLLSVLRHFQAATGIQSATPSIPVVGSGYRWLQWLVIPAAAGNLAAKGCSIVELERATLSQPDFVRQ